MRSLDLECEDNADKTKEDEKGAHEVDEYRRIHDEDNGRNDKSCAYKEELAYKMAGDYMNSLLWFHKHMNAQN